MYAPGSFDPCIGLLHTLGSFWRLTLVVCATAGIGIFLIHPTDPCSGERVFTQHGEVCSIKDQFPSYAEFKRDLGL